MKKLLIIYFAISAILLLAAIKLPQHDQNLEASLFNERALAPQREPLPANRKTQNTAEIRNIICYSTEESQNNMLKITIRAEKISERILGIGFDFNFAADSIKFLRYEAGGFFERGGEPFYLIKQPGRKNSIIAGISLKRGDALQNGSGNIVYFYFQRLKQNKSSFSFSNTIVSTIEKGWRKNLPNILWRACS